VAETGRAVSGMKSAEANALIKKIQATYADQLGAPPEGKNFDGLYEVKKIEPTSEYLDLYKQVKEQLAKFGVPYK
jgi:methylamine--corrinoid protein Co-methyltransferase